MTIRTSIALAVAAVSMTGCSAWVTDFRPPQNAACTATQTATLTGALDCITKLKETYRLAAGDYVNQQQIPDLITIGAAGAGLAAGLFGAHSDYYKVAGLTAGGAFALRNYYSGSDRAEILMDGIEALQCFEGLALEATAIQFTVASNATVAQGHIAKGISDVQTRTMRRSLAKQTPQHMADLIRQMREQAGMTPASGGGSPPQPETDFVQGLPQRTTACLAKAG